MNKIKYLNKTLLVIFLIVTILLPINNANWGKAWASETILYNINYNHIERYPAVYVREYKGEVIKRSDNSVYIKFSLLFHTNPYGNNGFNPSDVTVNQIFTPRIQFGTGMWEDLPVEVEWIHENMELTAKAELSRELAGMYIIIWNMRIDITFNNGQRFNDAYLGYPGWWVSGNDRFIINPAWFNQDPELTLSAPANNQAFSAVAGFNQISVAGQVRDEDVGDSLTVKYRINSGSAQNLQTGISANGGWQNYNGNINVGSQSEGTHTLYVWVEDDKGGVSGEVSRTFRVDKTVPSAFAPTATANSTSQITVSGTTTDPTSGGVSAGLHSSPYNFRQGTSAYTGWQAGSSRAFTGLTPNTQYSFNMQARDTVGNVRTSSTVNRYTLAATPSLTLGTATSTGISGTIAANGNPASTQYFVQRATDSGFTANVATVQNWTSDTSFTATGLSPGTTYYFRVKARNGENVETNWSSTVNKITAPAAPAAPSVTATGTGSFNISWGSVTGATSYDLYRNDTFIKNVTSTTTTDSGLTPNTQYTYTIIAKNTSGSSSESTGTSRYTLALDATGIDVIGKTSNSITFSITNDMGNGSNPQHNIQVRRKSDGVVISESGFSASTANRTVSSLSGGVEYEVWTISRNGNNIENSAVQRISSIYVIVEPSNILITQTSTNSITINWDTSPAHEYKLKLKDALGVDVPGTETDWGIIPPYIVENLAPNTLYKALVQSRQDGTESAWIEGQANFTDANPVKAATFEAMDKAVKITLDIASTGNPSGTKYIIKNLVTNDISPEVEETWTNTDLLNDMTYQYMAKVVNKNGKESEWFLIGTGYTAATQITVPPEWEDPVGGQPPLSLPDDFDPDTIEGKVVIFNGVPAIVAKGRYINISIENVTNAKKYAISLDGFGYGDWKDLDENNGFSESLFINTPGLYQVHVKFQNQYGGESQPFIRNFILDWIQPDISTTSSIKGQTATTDGTFRVVATGQDNLSLVLYNAGTGWQWYTPGQQITISGIPLNNTRHDVLIRFSDLNGNVTEQVHKLWGINN